MKLQYYEAAIRVTNRFRLRDFGFRVEGRMLSPF